MRSGRDLHGQCMEILQLLINLTIFIRNTTYAVYFLGVGR